MTSRTPFPIFLPALQAVFVACATTFRTWIEIACEDGYNGSVRRCDGRKRGVGRGRNGSAHDDLDDDDVPPLITEDEALASMRYDEVSPALLEVAVEISAKMAASPGLLVWAATPSPSSPSPACGSATSAVLTTIETLVGSLRSLNFPCRRESLQALNVIFSHLDADAVRGVFSEPFQSTGPALGASGAAGAAPAAPAAAETAPRFALALAEVLLVAMSRYM